MHDRILGLVGGLGPESTLDYYRRLVDGYHARLGTRAHPPVLINSIDGGPLIGEMVTGNLEPLRAAVARGVEQLAAAGAGIALIGSVASHQVFDAVSPAAAIPMLSIVDATCRAAVAAGIRRPAIFGTRMAVEGAFFSRPFEDAGVELIRPAEPDRAWINEIYLGELVNGVFLGSTPKEAVRVIIELDGLVDKFVGDEVVALFAPGWAGADHARRAMEAADGLLRATGHGAGREPWLPVGAAVHTGVAYVGAVGSVGTVVDFTALGDPVNATARLASAAPAGTVLVTQAALAAARVEPSAALRKASYELRGRTEPMVAYDVRSGEVAELLR